MNFLRFSVPSMIELFCILVFALPLVWIFNRYLWKQSRSHTFLALLFTIYLAKMYDIVGIPTIAYWDWNPEINLIPFVDWGSRGFLFQIAANAILFAPLGFFLPLLWKEHRRFLRTLSIGFTVSLSIELIQLFCFRASDIDDLLMNTLGTAVGYLCFHVFSREKPSRRFFLGSKEFWVTNLIVLLVIVFLRSPLANMIY